jgi:hypothetical protein
MIGCILVIPVKSTPASDIPCRNPRQTLQLVQPSFAKRYLMKAIFAKAWAIAVPQGDNMVMRR